MRRSAHGRGVRSGIRPGLRTDQRHRRALCEWAVRHVLARGLHHPVELHRNARGGLYPRALAAEIREKRERGRKSRKQAEN